MAAKTMTKTLSEAKRPFLIPDWPVPKNVCAIQTTRRGGHSTGVYASLNLGDHVGDNPSAVAANRQFVTRSIGSDILWLNQVHGTRVVEFGNAAASVKGTPPEADAAFCRQPYRACAVMTADCLPVLFCDEAGSVVAAAHAGWRGLLAGVLEATLNAMAIPGEQILAYLGPAIGPTAFEVGNDVRDAFIRESVASESAFRPGRDGKWLADLYALARQRLIAQGVRQIYGGEFCTVADAEHFFSYRRDGRCGRMASVIWLGATD